MLCTPVLQSALQSVVHPHAKLNKITKNMKFQIAAINNLHVKTNNKAKHPFFHVTCGIEITKNMKFQKLQLINYV